MRSTISACVSFRKGVALHAVERHADESGPRFLRQDPRPVLPRRIMSDVLGMAALEFGNPVLLFVLMESNNAALHGYRL